jgi:predicted lipoprotein
MLRADNAILLNQQPEAISISSGLLISVISTFKKMHMKFIRNSILVTLLIFSAVSCKKEDGGDGNNSFDRKEMLTNYADNLIIPAVNQLNSASTQLLDAVQAFIANKNTTSLTQMQNAWRNAYRTFQFANAYNFGPGGDDLPKKSMIEEIGIFPVSESKINARIAALDTNFADFNRDTRGFLAIEYMIYSLSDDNAAVLNYFQTNPNAEVYLLALAKHLNAYTSALRTAWNGGYRNEFINNAGTSIGSSTSNLYNEFVRSFESIKNFKLGLPLGKRPGQVTPEPTRVEAYYSGLSIEMMKLHFTAIVDIWYGKSADGKQGVSFKTYLESVPGGKELVASTENQLGVIKSILSAVPETRLSEQITTNTTQLENLYTELQRHTRFFKSDMSSLLGIAITYSSGDGD